MRETYRNPRNRREIEPGGTPRRDLTEIYHLERIDNWLQYIFWGVAIGVIIVLGVAIRIFASYF